MVEWKKSYLDLILVPCSLLIVAGYHLWLWYRVRTRPLSTIIGTNAVGRRFWLASILQDNEKKNILAVQTLRNTIMGSTLMATTSILLCTGLAAVLSSTYTIKKPLNDSVYGANGELVIIVKYVMLLSLFAFSFLCHSLSIRFINQVGFLINSGIIPRLDNGNIAMIDVDDCPYSCNINNIDIIAAMSVVTPAYVAALLEKGTTLNTTGNRIFYAALPLLLWIFGPVLVFLSSLTLVTLLYNHDILGRGAKCRTTTTLTAAKENGRE